MSRIQRSETQSHERAGLAFEQALWAEGYRLVAGVDEVGRGALAGPVVAAAVILPPDPARLAPLLGRVDDSKRLTPAARETLYQPIVDCALAVGVGRVEAGDIDRIGIAPATRSAMAQALASLVPPPDFILLDYLTLPDAMCAQRGIAHGDALCLAIAAASVIAKVTRDRWMAEQDAVYPGYDFARHKGYGTAAHHDALARLGPCALHRLSFAPLAGDGLPVPRSPHPQMRTGMSAAERGSASEDAELLDALPEGQPAQMRTGGGRVARSAESASSDADGHVRRGTRFSI